MADAPLFVGIDGGGTRCRARISDAQLNTLGEGVSGSANIFLPHSQVMATILAAVSEAATEAGLTTTDFSRMHVGMALAGAEDKRQQTALASRHWPFASVQIETDAYGACKGAFNGADGAIQIVGTGSVGLLLQQDECIRVGGHEFPISDQGSGAIIGLEAIRTTLLAYDGIVASSAMTDWIYHFFQQDSDEIVNWSKQAKPADYGRFARQVFDFADGGDPLAEEIIDRALVDVIAMINRLQQRGAKRVALMGAVALRMQPLLQQELGGLLVEPAADAMHGALLMVQERETVSGTESAVGCRE